MTELRLDPYRDHHAEEREQAWAQYHELNPDLKPARGLAMGVIYGLAVWAVIGLVVAVITVV